MICRVMAALVTSLVAFSSRAQSPSVLDLATERAVAYDASALGWTCDESVRRIRFRDGGSPSEKAVSRFTLSMTPGAGGGHASESTSPLDSPGRPTTRPRSLLGFPPVTSWLRLFHPDMRPWILIRDESGNGVDHHRFMFRGAFQRANGEDIREWEGMAWVDPRTGDLLRIEAVPASQSELLPAQVDRRNVFGVPINLFGFRFSIGPKARGRRVEILFGPQSGGFWLPTSARLEVFDAVSKRSEQPLRAAVLSLSRCRGTSDPD